MAVKVTIRLLEREDTEIIVSAFAVIGWSKPATQYERLLAQQRRGERVVLVAHSDGDFAGYVTVNWQSGYPPFAERGIPEIEDLNVLPAFRRRGVASKLVDEAERRVFERSATVGIGFGMYPDYGAAQRMYVLRGYVPDGPGLAYRGQPVRPGESVTVDDDLVLFLTKDRAKGPEKPATP